MHLKVLLPFQIFAEKDDVTSIVAETLKGSYGLLPRRLDCVAPLSPGILTYTSTSEGEKYIAVDEGILVKTGENVVVSVRHAHGGVDLGQLRAAVEKEFLNLDEREKSMRASMAELESGFIHQFAEYHRL